ncbi:MAG: TolC family protein [Acidobacteriota bacterium]
MWSHQRSRPPFFRRTVIALSLLTGVALRSQTSSLDALVASAIAQNPSLRAQRARVAAARQAPRQAMALPDPAVDLEVMNLRVRGPSESGSVTDSLSLGVTQGLPFPGKRALAAEAARQEATVEEARLRSMERTIRLEVLRAGYRFVTTRELLRINARSRVALSATAEGALARYSSGGGSQADVLLAQSAVTRVETQRQELESQARISLARLSSLIAAPVEADALEGIVLEAPARLPPLEALLASADRSAPDLRTALSEAAAAKIRSELARKNRKPDFMVGVRYRYKDMSMGGGDYLTAMVGMTLPFFHRRDRYEPALEEALQRQLAAEEEVAETKNSIRFQVAEAYQSATKDARVFYLYDQGLLLQARQAYEASLAAYATGRVDFGDLLMALTNLFSYEADAAVARGEYHQRAAELEAFLDRPLLEMEALAPDAQGGTP